MKHKKHIVLLPESAEANYDIYGVFETENDEKLLAKVLEFILKKG